MFIFLKLGGSLITDKRKPEVARHDVIDRLAAEIAAARQANPALKLLIGNGAGSFAHRPAKQYGTRDGAHTSQDWYGFAETADAAARLNRLVVAALLKAGLPAWSIQPSAALRCHNGKVVDGPAETIALALRKGLIPVVHGDVSLDSVRGATIASTEEIFDWLIDQLPAHLPEGSDWSITRWVLAGEVDGIYSADPLVDPKATRFERITPSTLSEMQSGLGTSHGVDVTGGMVAKVAQSFAVIARYPDLQIFVCSGLTPKIVGAALSKSQLVEEAAIGTCLSNS